MAAIHCRRASKIARALACRPARTLCNCDGRRVELAHEAAALAARGALILIPSQRDNGAAQQQHQNGGVKRRHGAEAEALHQKAAPQA
jgi:hypothetical protein